MLKWTDCNEVEQQPGTPDHHGGNGGNGRMKRPASSFIMTNSSGGASFGGVNSHGSNILPTSTNAVAVTSGTKSARASQSPIISSESERALLGFIADFLRRRGLTDTLQCLYAEAPLNQLIPLEHLDGFVEEISEIRGKVTEMGMLAEWWQVFWNLLRGGNESSGGVSARMVKQKKTNEDAMATMKSTINSSPQSTNVSTSPASDKKRAASHSSTSGSGSSSGSQSNSHDSSIASDNQSLDVESLAGIERSLSLLGLMNRDLTKLSGEEKGLLSTALRNNRVSIDAWTTYLQLCQEYSRSGVMISKAAGSTSGMMNGGTAGLSGSFTTMQNPDSPSEFTFNPQQQPQQYLSPTISVIDQESQPIDSRQLLLLRQSLYQQYLQKQSSSSSNPLSSRNGVVGSNASASSRNAPNSSFELGAGPINTPQIPLESPFYSPPRSKPQIHPQPPSQTALSNSQPTTRHNFSSFTGLTEFEVTALLLGTEQGAMTGESNHEPASAATSSLINVNSSNDDADENHGMSHSSNHHEDLNSFINEFLDVS